MKQSDKDNAEYIRNKIKPVDEKVSLPDEISAENITALEAFKSIIKLKNESAAKAWFFGILYNVCKRFQREKYRAEFTPLEFCGELSSADTNENVLNGLDLVRLINTLSEQEREIVLLSAVCGYSGKEIAEVTGIPHGTVRSKLSRALTKLREETEGRK